ncbi:FAD-binding oxidoreductase [Paenibacillus antri]|uniref:FAD-binding oxidoreductase n=1 Tax=Paenibacillus antri TaxID=2582848 RepID=A0A5R9G6Q9_9BACL|nr:FAD-binding oxidoreductase [Paenibacillus antri]TLS52082.1 FAD-binding oxidoreductase [Paenibacillus antri]
MATEWRKEAVDVLGEERFLLDPASREKLSKDYYWYSPVLEPLLREKLADGVAAPTDERELAAALAFAYRHRLPITVRGAGTGNYGQAVPLEGGIVLDVSGLNRVLEIGPGYARVQCGVRMGALEKRAREQGQELRIYPSTYAKATIGGFVCGGSGGIGSISWGNLWDGNVLEAIVYTLEERPRRLTVHGADLLPYIHNYGTTGVVTELVIPLAPRVEWAQSVVSFESFDDALAVSEALAGDDSIRKRLVSAVEWPIPAFFKPLAKAFRQGAAALLLETEDGSLEAVSALAAARGGAIEHVIPPERYRQGIGLSDFTWNHTTLWALKTEPSITYLQADFSLGKVAEQARRLKAEFGDEVLLHLEWIRVSGELVPTALPLVRYTDASRLYEIVAFCESIGVVIYDPHTWILEDGGRGEANVMQRKKRENDPLGLLNPGKLRTEGA